MPIPSCKSSLTLTASLSPSPPPLSHAVKHCVKLRTSSSYRKTHQEVLLVGDDLIQELRDPSIIHTLFKLDSEQQEPPGQLHSHAEIMYTSKPVMQKITGLESVPQHTLAALIHIPETTYSASTFTKKKTLVIKKLLVLDAVQDPGNMGTLLRTSLALDWHVWLLPGCCDPYNEKCLRSSRAAVFRVPMVVNGSLKEWDGVVEKYRLVCMAADPHADIPGIIQGGEGGGGGVVEVQIRGKKEEEEGSGVCLVLGSEGQGLSKAAVSRCHTRVGIPMNKEMESLNVAVAGAILMFCLSGNAEKTVQGINEVVVGRGRVGEHH